MNKEEIYNHLTDIIRQSLNTPSLMLTPDSTVENTEGWGSLENAMIITSIEQDYNIKFKLSELLSWHTLDELTDLIIKKTR